MTRFRAACIQMTSGDSIAENIAQLDPLLTSAAAQGANFIATPENTFYMRREGTAQMADGPLAAHEGIYWAQAIAAKHTVWLLIGSVRAREAGQEKATNRSVLIAPNGAIHTTYDKLHLFDVTLANGQSYRESSQAMAGDAPVLAMTPLANIGMTICYDVRFPNLYRALALKGAEVLTVPSAFTVPTGTAHWQPLLRARAIENACYVMAPAQCGHHPGGRATYGHTLMVDPWGTIIGERTEDTPGVVIADMDRALVASTRAQIPVLEHHRALTDVRVTESTVPK